MLTPLSTTADTARMTKLAALVLVICVAAVSCGGAADVYEVPPGQTGDLGLPPPVPAVPAWVLTPPRPLSQRDLQRIQKTPGVAVAAGVAVARVPVSGPGGRAVMRVGVIEPLRYRAVAPSSTRDADFVWTSLLQGFAVVDFEAAQSLGLRKNPRIDIDGRKAQVGAVADNGTPGIVDVLVGDGWGRHVGAPRPRVVVVGAETGAPIEALGRDLRRTIRGARLERVRSEKRLGSPGGPQAPPAPHPVSASGATLDTLNFKILKNGFIDPDPAWVRSNISKESVPVFGTVTCHRIMFPQLRSALEEAVARNLDHLIRRGDFGGCWVPRFIDRDPSQPLSMHAWGLAVDFNVSTNRLGTRGDMDPRLVEVFEKWGFEWGGRWSRPDPMHFEVDRIVGSTN